MDDNVRFPKPRVEAKDELNLLLQVIKETREQFKAKEIVKTLIGQHNAIINSHHTAQLPIFGKGKHKSDAYWMALIRQANVAGFLTKDIETYGIIRLTKKGNAFQTSPHSFMMTEDHSYTQTAKPSTSFHKDVVSDTVLKKVLVDLRKKVADQHEVPPTPFFKKVQSMI